jgi:hypothetical protein
MWWKNYLIVFIVTSVLVLVTMFSCNSAVKETKGSANTSQASVVTAKMVVVPGLVV